MRLSVPDLPNHLVLTATSTCNFASVLKLEYGALPRHEVFELLFVRETQLSELFQLAGAISPTDFTKAVAALRGGPSSAGEVPVFAGTEGALQLLSGIEILSALEYLGHRQFPILATREVASWFKRVAKAAEELPEGWQVQTVK